LIKTPSPAAIAAANAVNKARLASSGPVDAEPAE
jgi:hypothetical protein